MSPPGDKTRAQLERPSVAGLSYALRNLDEVRPGWEWDYSCTGGVRYGVGPIPVAEDGRYSSRALTQRSGLRYAFCRRQAAFRLVAPVGISRQERYATPPRRRRAGPVAGGAAGVRDVSACQLSWQPQ